MLVKECMTTNVSLGAPNMTMLEAAKKMRDGDFGILPIQENEKLVGMVTDRDIAVRGVAEGRDPNLLKTHEIMSQKVLYCFDDQDIDEVALNLGENQVRRLPVVNREKKLVGILSICDLAKSQLDPTRLEDTLCRIVKNNHANSQSVQS